MNKLALAAAALIAAPACAQPAAPPAVQPDVDPARLALARTSVDAVWPLGTYERMMNGTMDKMMDAMFQSMFDMRIGDFAPPGAPGKSDPKLANQTMRQVMEKEDPHFAERLRIMNRVMMEEMIPLMNRMEPGIREALSRAYARRFTSAQLADMNRFFATPSGRYYASESMLVFMDPEMMAQIVKAAPELVREMPRIMEKVKAATADLPLPTRRRPAAKP